MIRVGTLLGFVMLIGEGSAIASDACDDPVKSFCTDQPPVSVASTDQIRAEVKRRRGGKDLVKLGGDPAQAKANVSEYRDTLQKTHEVLMEQFRARGMTEKDIQDRVAATREHLAQNLEEGRMGISLAASGPRSNAGMAAKIRSIRFIGRPQDDAEAEGMYALCGVDGLNQQAFYWEEKNAFVICPGFLLEVARQGSVAHLDFVVGHELAHEVDARLENPSYFKYPPYLSCIETNYADKLESSEHVLRELNGPAQKRIDDHLKTLNPLTDGVEIALTEQKKQFVIDNNARLRAEIKKFTQLSGKAPTKAHMHGGELSADLGATEAIVRSFHDNAKGDRKGTALAAIRAFCPNRGLRGKKLVLGPLLDDGEHPNGEFRIRAMLSHPEFRLALGCQSLSPPAPHCSLDPDSPIAVRCDRGHGGDSSSACADRVKSSLRSAGCSLKNLDCGASDGTTTECTVTSPNCRTGTQSAQGPGCTDRTRADELKKLPPPLAAICVAPNTGRGPGAPAQDPNSKKAL